MRLFDYPTYTHIKEGKLEPRSLSSVFLGYPNGIKGYKLWCTDLKPLRATINRDIAFNKFEMLQHTAPLKLITTENIDKD